MFAVKRQVVIPPSRHIELDLPADTPEGVAEVIVLVPDAKVGGTTSLMLFPGISEDAWEEADRAIAEARRSDEVRHSND